jgi:hypothetical protein
LEFSVGYLGGGAATDKALARIHGIEHALRAVFPLVADVDRNDVGSTIASAKDGTIRLHLFDNFAGGTGLAEFTFSKPARMVTAAQGLLNSCQCSGGCPRCPVVPWCESGNDNLDKRGGQLIETTRAGSEMTPSMSEAELIEALFTETPKQIAICSPWVSSEGVALLGRCLERIPTETVELLQVWCRVSIEDHLQGRCDYSALLWLLNSFKGQQGRACIELATADNLHAKVYCTDYNYLVESANLTGGFCGGNLEKLSLPGTPRRPRASGEEAAGGRARHPDMVQRWVASAWVLTEKHFRRIDGHADLWALAAILGRETKSTDQPSKEKVA